MDPLSALSIAAGVVQFVDFTFRLVSGTRAIIKSGSGLTSDTNTLNAIAKDAKGLSNALTTSLVHASSNPTLQALVSECKTIADELLAVLSKLRANKTKKWNCFVIALRTTWSKGMIDEFVSRLGKVQAQISAHMHFLLMEHIKQQSGQIDALRANAQRLGIENQDRIENLRQVVVTRLESLSNETSKTQRDMQHLMDSLKAGAPKTAATGPTCFGLSPGLTRYFSEAIKQLAEEQSLTALSQDFLESLYFSKIKARQRKIAPAHAKTFRWIYNRAVADGSKEIFFDQWLRESNETFWIQGKAGSGKSTLMKFISSHPTTVKLLQEWAGNNRLVTAEFFFWNAGTVLQKSMAGLLRSLLFEILRKCPELIPQVSKGNQKFHFRSRNPYLYPDDEELWSQEELMGAYQSLLACCDEVDVKFCIFIDGLDEFEEVSKTHSDLIKTLHILDTSQNIKLCISSRPWIVFSDAFGEDPDRLLKLEDLTREDIHNYTHERFNENRQFQLLSINNPQYASLVEDITSRAQGVFLWVALVVRNLLDGFSHSDTIRTIRKRLKSLPSELEQFFQHMIDSVPAIYVPQMARTMWVATLVPEPLPVVAYSLLDDVSDDTAAFANRYPAVMRDDELRMRIQQMRRRFDGRCKGLLEIVADEPDASLYFEFKVDLHRTVRDFLLDSPSIHQMLVRQRFADLSNIRYPSNVWLLPSLSILEAFKRAPFRAKSQAATGDARIARRLLESLMIFAHEAEMNMTDHSALIRMLHDAEETYDRRNHFSSSLDNYLFLGLACRADLFSYIEFKITRDFFIKPYSLSSAVWGLRPNPSVALLGYALDASQTLHPRIIQHLLNMGADPHERATLCDSHTSSWCIFFQDVSTHQHVSEDELVRDVERLLLEHNDNQISGSLLETDALSLPGSSQEC